MIRRPPRSTLDRSSAASDVYKRQTHNMAERATAITFLFGHLMIFQAALNLMSAVFNPFYEFQKYFVVGAEIAIIFLLSLRFFKASMIESIWKSILITVFLFMSMQYILLSLIHISEPTRPY